MKIIGWFIVVALYAYSTAHMYALGVMEGWMDGIIYTAFYALTTLFLHDITAPLNEHNR